MLHERLSKHQLYDRARREREEVEHTKPKLSYSVGAVPSTPDHPERRITGRCPGCGRTGIKRETTIKGKWMVLSWRCGTCAHRWRERRRNSPS